MNLVVFDFVKNYLVVLMSSKQLLCLFITQLLPESGEQVAEFCRADETISILQFTIFQIILHLSTISDNPHHNFLYNFHLVKVPEAFNEVITSIGGPAGTYCLNIYMRYQSNAPSKL